MDFSYHLQEINLNDPWDLAQMTDLLARFGLRLEPDLEGAAGLFEGERLVACGGFAGNVLKCFAVDESLRGENALGTLLSSLIKRQYERGITQLFVFTKPETKDYFRGLGFSVLAEAEKAVLLENSKRGLAEYLASLRPLKKNEWKKVGAIVMNANPFTNGHLALVWEAAVRCDWLHIFVVQEDRSSFSFADRFRLVQEGTGEIPNVSVHPGGPYVISYATFPTYFLKKEEEFTSTYAEIDAALFGTSLAPVLGISDRFVGEEPFCPVTAIYNQVLQKRMPEFGVNLHVCPRVSEDGEPISASRVRALLKEPDGLKEIKRLVPETTYRYLTKKLIESGTMKLSETSPKGAGER